MLKFLNSTRPELHLEIEVVYINYNFVCWALIFLSSASVLARHMSMRLLVTYGAKRHLYFDSF